jgi:regulator of protease activity HflC (stomatin/prohibitin superfamily)
LAVERAARWQVVLAAVTWPTLAVGVAAGLAALTLRLLEQPVLAGALVLPGAAALSAAAALLPALLLAGARRRVAEAMEADLVQRQQRAAQLAANAARSTAGDAPQALFSGDEDPDLLQQAERARVLRLAGWPQAVIALPLAVAAIALAIFAWPVAGVVPGGIGIGIALLVLAFPTLVIERRLTLVAGGAPATSELPEAAGLARLVRLLVWALVVGGACEIARALGASVVVYALYAMIALVMAVAAELALRLSAAPFLPAANLAEARGLGDSALAGLILPRLGAGGGGGTELKERFGIDLSQSWALNFVRAASLPLLLALLVLGWLLSGVTTLSLQERGVYERLGTPVAVLPSGLHVHLPWPFGVVHRLDAGAVYELAVGLEPGGEDAKVPQRLAADTLDTRTVDRLWSTKHAADALYLVPDQDPKSVTRSAQVLGSDVRVFYRIGLDDDSAKAALYGLTRPADTVRTAARRQLARVFATRPLMAAIGEDRVQLGASVRTALQQDLNTSGSGLEVIAVTIDSIHPPVEAAAAYHGVQEATIIAAREVADARRSATIVMSEKTIEGIVARANGEWLAATRVAEAKVDTTRFAAEADAWRTAPKALALERWLEALGKGLPRSQLDIIDHRLRLLDGPVLDMRKFGAPTGSNE